MAELISDTARLASSQPQHKQLQTYHLQCLAIHLFNLTKTPIKDLRILQSLNPRVHVIFFLPHGSVVRQAQTVNLDPVIPLTTFDLGATLARLWPSSARMRVPISCRLPESCPCLPFSWSFTSWFAWR